MNELLKTNIEDYQKTNWEDLLREDLGKHNLKALKPNLDFIKKFIDDLIENIHKLSIGHQNSLVELIVEFTNCRADIKTHTDTKQNHKVVNNFNTFKDKILDHYKDLSMALDTLKKYSPDKTPNDPEIEIKKFVLARKELEQEFKKIQKIQSQFEAQAVMKEAGRYGDFFTKEAEKNRKLSWWFGVGGFVFALCSAVFAHCYLRFNEGITADSFVELLIEGDVINKFFIFSVIFLIIFVLKREYLALRHQFTLNRHRQNALRSHKEVLKSIKTTETESDKEIANAILLELTKSMFTPQETGFVKNQSDISSGSKIVEISKSIFGKSKD